MADRSLTPSLRSPKRSVLSDDDDEYSGNSVEMHGRNNECGFSNYLFHTGSGLLVWRSSTVNEQFGWQDLLLSGTEVGMKNNGAIGDDVPFPRSLVSKSVIYRKRTGKGGQYKIVGTWNTKFLSAGGRSLSVSSEALKRARSLLGDPDIGTFLNVGDAVDQGLSVFKIVDLVMLHQRRKMIFTLLSPILEPQRVNISQQLSFRLLNHLQTMSNHPLIPKMSRLFPVVYLMKFPAIEEKFPLDILSSYLLWSTLLIKSNKAGKYRFCYESSIDSIGAEAVYNMLVQSGASSQDASKV
ncbi:hypothetical protein DKX38_009519 [Salix brachista]|uniref:Uncharacterized protein n=1 Tax=Salix brachista TaxID=2182728 RepID=A0A5N5MAX6_9ROSI|nr:hypothetical protein DKX38_009519 [Salix brachista]